MELVMSVLLMMRCLLHWTSLSLHNLIPQNKLQYSYFLFLLSSVEEDAIASSNSKQTWFTASSEMLDGGLEDTFLRKAKPSTNPTDPSQPNKFFEPSFSAFMEGNWTPYSQLFTKYIDLE